MNYSRFRRWIILALVLLLLLLGVSSAARYFGDDPAIARARALRAELTSEAVRSRPAEERRERWRQYGEQLKQLKPEQRDQLDEERRLAYHKQLELHFRLPRPEQAAHLDREIDRMEAARKRWQAAQAQRAVGGASTAGPPGGRGPGGPAAGPGSRQPPSAEERERRRKDRLDRTTPEQRARMAEYRKQLEVRRKERGLPASSWPGRG